jgi:hypothetical protein
MSCRAMIRSYSDSSAMEDVTDEVSDSVRGRGSVSMEMEKDINGGGVDSEIKNFGRERRKETNHHLCPILLPLLGQLVACLNLRQRLL